jgi:hypothetical protein
MITQEEPIALGKLAPETPISPLSTKPTSKAI